jgi:hypothetical protein
MDPRIVKKGKQWHFEPLCGNDRDECVATAITEAKALGEPITLHFNENVLKITGDTDPVQLEQERREQSRKIWAARRQSPAYKAQQAREAAAHVRDQKKIDDLMASLDGALAKGIGAAVGWMKDYSAVAEDGTLKTDHGLVLKKVLAAGYQSNAHVDRPEGALDGDYKAMGEYIMGQCIKSMEKGYPPHPVAGMFADKMAEIKKVKSFPVMHTIKLNGKAPPPDTINLVPQIKFKPPAGG